ncbi:hypothetical protein ACSBR1_037709 [Camellia fascicularis]
MDLGRANTCNNSINHLFQFYYYFFFIKHITTNGQTPRPPPGPPGLPFIGNLHQIILNSSAPHNYLYQLAQEHGPLMSLRLGSVPTLMVSSAKMVKHVMKTHDFAFSGRPILLRQQKLSYNGLDVAFSPYNDSWREMRKIFVHLFSSNRVQSFGLIREDKVSRMVKKISQLADSSKVVNLSEVLMFPTITLICRVAFGKRYEEREGLKEAREEFQELDLFYQDLIDDHLNSKRTEFMQEDILDILLQLRNDQFPPIDLTLDRIKAVLMNIFAGGTDTGVAAVVWVMIALMKNPKVMKKVHEK